MPDFQSEGSNVRFWLRVKPRACREKLSVDAAGKLRLDLHAPASEGQANEACIQFFARHLRLPKACIVILSGHKARRKLLRVTGHSAEETIAKIRTLTALPAEGVRNSKPENRNSQITPISCFDSRVSNLPAERSKY